MNSKQIQKEMHVSIKGKICLTAMYLSHCAGRKKHLVTESH